MRIVVVLCHSWTLSLLDTRAVVDTLARCSIPLEFQRSQDRRVVVVAAYLLTFTMQPVTILIIAATLTTQSSHLKTTTNPLLHATPDYAYTDLLGSLNVYLKSEIPYYFEDHSNIDSHMTTLRYSFRPFS